jgi:hypothetical protein
MRISQFGRYALSLSIAVLLLAGCGGNLSSSTSTMPMVESQPATPLHRGGIDHLYVDAAIGFSSSEILGYRIKGDRPTLICKVKNVTYADNIAVDGKGNLIAPNSASGQLIVFKGPRMCGPELGSVNDLYGQPTAAASNDAASGPIVVGNLLGPGFVVVCTMASSGCSELKSPPSGIGQVAGVAMANNGDCWASGYNASFSRVILVYFKRCSRSGRVATGYQNTGSGGLDIDAQGNLVSISWAGSQGSAAYVYQGCNPKCSLVGGPLALQYQAIQGHLNGASTALATVDVLKSQVDVYSYSPTNVTYQYSFNNGISGGATVAGVAYNPRSKE